MKKFAIIVLIVLLSLFGLVGLYIGFFYYSIVSFNNNEPYLYEEIAMDGYKLKIYSSVDILGDPTCNMLFIEQEKEVAPNKFVTKQFPLENIDACNYQYNIIGKDEIVIWSQSTSKLAENSPKIHLKFK